jgi:class 3 adenylate cyclase
MRDLRAIETAPDPEALIADIYGRYLRAEAVVFLARPRSDPGPHLDAILDDLLMNALMDAAVLRSIPHRHLVRCLSGLSILTFPDVDEALEFALDIREKFQTNELPMKIGIDYGAILYFERPDGQRNLMGDPVNVVSKISEDAGVPGRICITTRAAEVLPRAFENAEPFRLEVSKVAITGFML